MLAGLAHIVMRHRRLVIGVWIALTLFGVFAGSQVSKRWYQSFSIPGKPAYESNQRTLEKFGTGIRPPDRRGLPLERRRDDGRTRRQFKTAMKNAANAASMPGSRTLGAHELVLHDERQPDVRLEGQAHDVRGDLSAGSRNVLDDERRIGHSRRRAERAAERASRSTSPATTRSRRRVRTAAAVAGTSSSRRSSAVSARS